MTSSIVLALGGLGYCCLTWWVLANIADDEEEQDQKERGKGDKNPS